MTENFEKIVEALSKESLQDALDACATEANVVELLSENGVNTTESELKSVLTQLMNRAHTNELSEKQLEQVAGGYSWSAFWKGFKSIMNDIKEGISTLGQHGGI